MKSKKSALLMSFTSLLICFAMLVGSTFAWFTDTATTGVNKIVAGNLKVDLVAAEADADGKYPSLTGEGGKLLWTQKVVSGSNETLKAVETEGQPLWEPGVNFLTQGFKIANKGNLALKWKVEVNKGTTAANAGDYDLLDVIDFSVVTETPATDKPTETPLAAFEGQLKDGNTVSTDTYYIKGHMQEEAGNNYQSLTLDGITVTVYATQLNHENDSFNNQYDKDAQYPITSFADLKAAVEWNGKYNVTEDLDPDASLIIKNAVVTLNATGKTIANTQDIYNAETYDWSMISVRGWMGNLTITGGTFAAKENDCFVIDVRDGGYLTIEDGKFIGNEDAIYVERGTATIEGGFFDIQQKHTGSTLEAQYKTLLNCQDANYNAGRAKIIVKGGTFVNFDPSNNLAEGANTNFVAPGYKVISETQSNGDIWYTVVAE